MARPLGYHYYFLANRHPEEFESYSSQEEAAGRGTRAEKIPALKILKFNPRKYSQTLPLTPEGFLINMEPAKKLGADGEALVQRYLQKNHYRIIAANERGGRLEIDLIAEKNQELIFVEVKTRRDTPDSRHENPLTARQIKNLKKAINAYCAKNQLDPELARLDLIIVKVSRTGQANLVHYRNIF